MRDTALVLASRSPRRVELLAQLGLRPRVRAAAVDETPRPGEHPALYVERLARAKARQVREALGGGAPVLGADTAVVVDDDILGKPRDREEALSMLARLSGRAHQVLTGVALAAGDALHTRVSVSRVHFRDIATWEREAYWATGEPRDKAGAYAIQGLGAVFVRRIEGSYSGIMGLPLFETAELLRRAGIEILAAPPHGFRAPS
jgi:septum formation protein